MSDTARDLFITGLKNAHAMESQAQEILERQIERMDKYAELVSRLRQHLTETKEQMKRLEGCLEKFDTSHSSFKDTVLAFGSNIAAMGHAVAGDEVLRNTLQRARTLRDRCVQLAYSAFWGGRPRDEIDSRAVAARGATYGRLDRFSRRSNNDGVRQERTA